MPRGPKGEKRPADVIGTAIMVAKIATGEIGDQKAEINENSRKGGLKGGKVRATKLGPKKRAEIAKKAAKARWGHSKRMAK